MKKKILSIIAVSILIMTIATSCEKSVTGVSLNKSAITLKVNQSETLIANVLPEKAANKAVTWTSSNSLVASVLPNGLVTGIAKGTATIMVITQDGNFMATCTVTVSASASEFPVTSVQLNKTELTLGIGVSETLTATVLPTNATNKNVTWTSSNTPIATVNGTGLVTAVAQGTATITVTTVEGGYTATCEVTCVNSPLPVISTLAATNITNNSATLGGNITNTGTPAYTSKGICYSTSQNPTTSDLTVPVSGGGTGSFTGTATGLSVNTTYYARAYVSGSQGTIYGNLISFTTTTQSSTQSQVRFKKYTYCPEMVILAVVYGAEDGDIAYTNGGSGSDWMSEYTTIPAGNHEILLYFLDDGIQAEGWYYWDESTRYYNFQASRKYTITFSDDGYDYILTITNDGSFSPPAPNKSQTDVIRISKDNLLKRMPDTVKPFSSDKKAIRAATNY